MKGNSVVTEILRIVISELENNNLTEEKYEKLYSTLQTYLESTGIIPEKGIQKNSSEEERPFIYPDLKWPV